jgi:transporter family protein
MHSVNNLVVGGNIGMWIVFAILSAVFAALTSILAKVGIEGVSSNLATGASWLCYYRALQIGEASKVVPIDKMSVVITLILAFVFLHEEFTSKSLVGCILISVGTLVMVL